MNVGLPGTGLGGLFYLSATLAMLFVEIYITLRGKSSFKRWHLVLKQLIIAFSIIAGIILTAYLLSLTMLPKSEAVKSVQKIMHADSNYSFLLYIAPLPIIIIIVQILRLFFGKRAVKA